MTDQSIANKPTTREPTLIELKEMLEALAEGYGNVGQHFINAAASIEAAMEEIDQLADDGNAP